MNTPTPQTDMEAQKHVERAWYDLQLRALAQYRAYRTYGLGNSPLIDGPHGCAEYWFAVEGYRAGYEAAKREIESDG